MKTRDHHGVVNTFFISVNEFIMTMRFSAVLTGILLGVVSIEGATINVTSLNESGSGSLRQAIFAGASGDTIQVLTQGKITLMKGELAINKSLIIIGPGMQCTADKFLKN